MSSKQLKSKFIRLNCHSLINHLTVVHSKPLTFCLHQDWSPPRRGNNLSNNRYRSILSDFSLSIKPQYFYRSWKKRKKKCTKNRLKNLNPHGWRKSVPGIFFKRKRRSDWKLWLMSASHWSKIRQLPIKKSHLSIWFFRSKSNRSLPSAYLSAIRSSTRDWSKLRNELKNYFAVLLSFLIPFFVTFFLALKFFNNKYFFTDIFIF